jgi:zinc finger protein
MAASNTTEHADMFRSIGQVVEDAVAAADAATAHELSTANAPDAHPQRLGEDEEGRPQVQRMEGDVMVIKSLCVQCEEDGLTRLLLTRIPFFRDVILMAFECEHCGYRSSEVQSAEFQERGVRFELTVSTPQVRFLSCQGSSCPQRPAPAGVRVVGTAARDRTAFA